MIRVNIDREWQFTPKAMDFYSFVLPVERVVNLPMTLPLNQVSPDARRKHTGFYKGGIGSYIKNLDIPKVGR